MAVVNDARLAELERNLAAVRDRVAAACAAAGRDAGDVTIVAVAKMFPASDVLLLQRLGVTDFGESYDVEASAKAATLREMGVVPRWHFVGGLQRNKARSVATYADVVHSLDRTETVVALANAATRAGRTVTGLVQVRFDDNPLRGGADPDGVRRLADEIAATATVRFGGVMCVAPLGVPARLVFARLRAIADAVRADHPGATTISAGMTGDFEDAVAEGANCLRVGTALFGGRAPKVG